MPLGDGHGRDHTGTKAGHAELSGDVVAALHVGPADVGTVGSAPASASLKAGLRYAASGFVTCSNRGGAGTAAGSPLLQPLELFAGGAGEGDELGCRSNQIWLRQFTVVGKGQMLSLIHI